MSMLLFPVSIASLSLRLSSAIAAFRLAQSLQSLHLVIMAPSTSDVICFFISHSLLNTRKHVNLFNGGCTDGGEAADRAAT